MPRATRLSRSICGALAMSAVLAGAAGAAPAQRPGGSGPSASGPHVPFAAATFDSSMLALRAGTFDPLVTALAPPDPSLAAAGDTRYGIVQFRAGRMPSQARLAALGVDVVAYLPDHAYLVRWNGAREAVAALPETRWTGPYLPGYKFDPTLWSAQVTDLTLIGFPGTNPERFSATLEKRIPGLVRIARYDDPQLPRVHVRVPLASLDAALLEVAKLEDVMFIERYTPVRLLNDDAYGPIQANVASDPTPAVTSDTPIWNRGITGSGQIVTVADSGLDRNHCSFVQLDKGTGVVRAFTDAVSSTPPLAAALFPDRKVIGYWTQPGATAYDSNSACVTIGGIPNPNSFHGTHVVGSVLGDRGTASNPGAANYDEETPDPVVGTETKPGDGMAPNAQILFQDIGNDDTGCLSGIGVLDDMFEQARRGGARIHSNSWGAATEGVYGGYDADADRGVYGHEDMLVLFAAGNDGAGATTIGSPGNAKNVLTIGANAHGNSATIASFSSRGPTADGRTKPDVTAPGSATVSAQGDTVNDGVSLDQVEALQCGAQSLSGTSMATPTVAGGAALMRQYFADGFYPTGARNAADAYSPSGALMKAVLMNGASAPATLPNQTFGWGRVWLDANLYFPGDTRKLRHFDVPNGAGLETGETQEWTIEVPAGTPRELRATLTWIDPPATPAAAKALVNDLDLEVIGPGGTFLGNVFTADSSSSGGTRDSKNNTEVVRLKTAGQGTYTLRVKGTNVPGSGIEGSTRQGYALAVSSATCASQVATAPDAPVATDLGLAGISLALTAPANATSTQVYRARGTCATAASEFRLVGAAAGGTFVDSKVTGGFSYAYRTRGADLCGEGPVSACTEVVSTAACDLLPSFDVESVTVTNNPSGGNCGTRVAWSGGAARCPSATGVRYNIYRSTQFDFTPGPANLIASGIEGTSYDDVAVDPLTTYFYVVRAEDTTADGTGPANGGNESAAIRRVNGVAHGPMVAGTYADSVEPAFMRVETPWSISNDAASDGTLSYRSAADGAATYLNEQCAAVTTPPILLGAAPALSYDAKYDLEDQWDGVVVEISDDGGATWDDLPPSPAYPSTFAQTQEPPVNRCGYPFTHGAFGGTSGGVFKPYTSSLADYASSTVQLRWRLSSDPATEEAGFFLDKLRITDAQTAPTCTRVTTNQPPTAVADAAAVAEDSGASAIDVLANDTDADGGPKSVEAVTQPANGAVAITGGGAGLSYTPDADFCSATADTFTYTLNGGSSATVSVTVGCVDDAPVAVDDVANVAQDSAAATIPVLANDTDVDGGPKTIAGATQPANGTVVVAVDGSALTYAPDAGYCAATPDTFTYSVNGGSSATVSVLVSCASDAPPTAVADDATVAEDSGANPIDVLANDTDSDGGPKSIAGVTQPASGTVVVTGGGAGLSYAPDADFCSAAPDTFTYSLNGGSSATVAVTVNCVDDAPVAVDDVANVAQDSPAATIPVLDNDTDIDGGPKSIAGATQPANGTVVVAGDGSSLTYAPDAGYCAAAPDTFTYTLNGGSSASVAVLVSCPGDNPPTAVADSATVAEDSGANAIDVLANDTDSDGGPKSIASVTQPASGTVVVTGGGTGLSYAPDANFCSATADTFTYALNGGSSATVSVTVSCVDDAPVARSDEATVAEDAGATAVDVLANDTDADGGPKSIQGVTQPANGTVAITGGGTGLTYTGNANFCSSTPEDFSYTLNGGSSATVSVTVSCVDDAPVAVADAATVPQDTAATPIPVLGNDTDVDGGPMTIASVTDPANGTATITGNGAGLTYRPDAGFCSLTPDTFSYTLDGGSSAVVSVTVTCTDPGARVDPIYSDGFE